VRGDRELKNIKLSNIPSHNLREQFYNHYHLVKSDEFIDEIKNWQAGKAIKTIYISWYEWPDQFFTFLTQLSVIGLESYVSTAVYFELGRDGRLSENIKYIKDPFSIPGEKGTAAKLYKLMPALYSENITLPNYNPRLWEELKIFYKFIRNPLFHGKQLDTSNPEDLIEIFEFLADIYVWIDSWHSPDSIIPGSNWVTKLNRT
jgi:hypothetical protein